MRIVQSNKLKVFNIDYDHLVFDNRDELYVTRYGRPFIENLYPENMWTDEEWFSQNAKRLCGTSCLYHVRTKEIQGKHADIVLKWNRMGQDIPGIEFDESLTDADFNSPFEEFSLVMELRHAAADSGDRIITHKPYAVYVPATRVEIWQSGRRKDKFERLVNCHEDVTIDINRLYAVIYEWIRGVDAAELCLKGTLGEKEIETMTHAVDKKLFARGFSVRDRKPHHIILRPDGPGDVLRDRKGEFLFGLIDFELLERLPEAEQKIRKARRSVYLKKQQERFNPAVGEKLPSHLHQTNVLGVDYIFGQTTSTQGALWVVGRDPDLFDYFLPEKWERTPRIKLSVDNETFYTLTKDNIHLVFKRSRVGMRPNLDPFKTKELSIIEYGYNSPFEEVSLAFELSRRGIPTIYPRGIYMTGHKVGVAAYLTSDTRYRSHRDFSSPDGRPVLQADRDYVIIYGYWNGPDEKLSQSDSDYEEGIDALRAYKEGIIDRAYYLLLLSTIRQRLRAAGLKDLNLRGSHFLLSFDGNKNIIKDTRGLPEMRYCNFEFLTRKKKRMRGTHGRQTDY